MRLFPHHLPGYPPVLHVCPPLLILWTPWFNVNAVLGDIIRLAEEGSPPLRLLLSRLSLLEKLKPELCDRSRTLGVEEREFDPTDVEVNGLLSIIWAPLPCEDILERDRLMTG
jgi:hypothetical protein